MTLSLYSQETLLAWSLSDNIGLRMAAEIRLAQRSGRLPDPDDPSTYWAMTQSQPTPPATEQSQVDQWVFITTERLVRDTTGLIPKIPPTVDMVVSIPRSGLLPGSIIASHLHVPLWACSRQNGLVDPGHGFRVETTPGLVGGDPRHVLLVDDTTATGREMSHNAGVVHKKWPRATITKMVVYAHPQARHAVDICHSLYPGSHYLEWNWCNAGHGQGCAYDFDGIICKDGAPEEPLYLPRRTNVPMIVTGRHEVARRITQDWLDKWGVRVDSLVMRDFGEPDCYEGVAEYKAKHYAESGLSLFAESDPSQAETINRITGKPVLCPQLGRVLPPCVMEPEKIPVAEAMAILKRARQCPHYSKPDCGCRWGNCKLGKGRDGEVTASDCRRCLDEQSTRTAAED